MISRKLLICSIIAIAFLTIACGTVSAYSIQVQGSEISQIISPDLQSRIAGIQSSSTGSSILDSIMNSAAHSSSGSGSSGYVSAYSSLTQNEGNENGVVTTMKFEEFVSVSGTINTFSYSAHFTSRL